MIHPLAGMALVLAALGALMGGLRAASRRYSIHPELLRKMVHIGMGLVTLSFPWLFRSAWPVAALGAIAVAGLFALRASSRVRSQLGGVLDAVERESLGEIYFPASVALLFFLSRGDPILFCVPVLVLSLADALSALIGVAYGRVRYETAEGHKSVEGSIAFFAVAFLSVHIPVLLFSGVGREESLLIGFMLGLLAMMLEAIAWRGLDNLFIPLGGYLLLRAYLPMDAATLHVRVAMTLGLALFVLLGRRRTTLNDSALLGAVLFGYVCWTVGGWRWLVAPATLFLAYPLLSPPTAQNTRRIHTIHPVMSVVAPGLAWLCLSLELRRPELLYPFTLAMAGHLAIIAIARLKFDWPWMANPALLAICVLEGWLIIFLPFVLFEPWSGRMLPLAAMSAGGVALAALSFFFLQPGVEDCPTDTPRWIRQGLCASAGSLLGLIPIFWGKG